MEEDYILVNKSDRKYIGIIHRILLKCGVKLASKGLFHWIPPYSCCAIRRDCELKNVVLVYDKSLGDYTSTFQMQIGKDGVLLLSKLATLPKYEGRGIGAKNLKHIEDFALSVGCDKICFDVYAKSRDALQFYRHHGYDEVGTKHSLRFKEVIMEKSLNQEV